jgi:RND superfamily putative drug exporter
VPVPCTAQTPRTRKRGPRTPDDRFATWLRDGTLRGVAVTGGVITAAGLVLAGTFAALTQIPQVSITEVGTAVALGVLLDTLIVRTVLVPAALLTIGDRVWWPSRPRR